MDDMSEASTALKQWIQESLTQRGWSQSELARRAKLSSTTVSDVLSGSAKPGFNFCKGVARAFGVRTQKVLMLAGLLPPEPEETPTSRELLYMFMQLNDEDQERILSITRTFLEEEKARVIIGGERPATT